MCRIIPLAAAIIGSVCASAAPFSNLDFEQANTNNISAFPGSEGAYPSGFGTVQELLPHWQLSYGGDAQSEIFLNVLARDPWAVSLISKDALSDHSFVFPGGFEGKFALGFTVGTTPFTLSQTADIPRGAFSLTIAAPRQAGTRLEARLNGVLVLSDTGSAVESADISAFAGQTAELEIRLWLDHLTTFGPYVGLDTISFAVSEPRAGILLAFAGLLAGVRFFWSKARS